MSTLPQYRAARQRQHDLVRVVLNIPRPELEALDSFGVANGMSSRTATIRHLLQKALNREQVAPAGGAQNQ